MNLLRRVASLPGLRGVLLRPRVRHLVASMLALRFLVAAAVTTQPLRLVVGEVVSRGEVRLYTIARTGVPVALQHGRDLEALFEIFHRGEYEAPEEIASRLREDKVRKVVDVGANVGMFAAWAAGRWPAAEIVSLEPSPESTHVYRRWLSASGAKATLIEAAASTHDGEMEFLSGLGGGSREVAAGLGTVTVPAVDVFPVLASADFVKIDIEGGEWSILTDPRMADLSDLVLVMEYHRANAPRLPALDAARDLLQAAGFATGYGAPNFWGHGTLWAWKD
jgi:FkbM family methyltransferase